MMELLTSRLRLREFEMQDWQAVLAYQQDPRYLRFYAWDERTEQDARRFVRMMLNQKERVPRVKFQLAVTMRETGELIGNCGVRKERADSGVGDIGYEISPEYWGKGLATEAVEVMVAFGFEKLNLRRIWAQCIAENAGSWRVMEKVGMRREGRLRQIEWFKGRWWDMLVYAIVAEEWHSKRGSA